MTGVLDEVRLITRKYSEFVGVTHELAEPYFIAAYLSGVAAHPAALREKTIAQVVQEYDAALERIVRDALRTMDVVDLRRAHKALIRSVAQRAYVEGMREAGGEEEDLESEDLQTITSWVDEQVGFVNDFVSAVGAAAGVGAPEGAAERVLSRVPLWSDSLRTLGDLGRASMLQNRSGLWQLGETEKHCKTCLWLDGQRHRVKWFTGKGYIPRQNGSKTLECQGFFCDCGVYDAKSGERLL